MLLHPKRASVVIPDDLIHPIGELEPTVLDRHPCRLVRNELAIQVHPWLRHDSFPLTKSVRSGRARNARLSDGSSIGNRSSIPARLWLGKTTARARRQDRGSQRWSITPLTKPNSKGIPVS